MTTQQTEPIASSAWQPDRPARAELLAPAGDWDAMRAAVSNGADAVYFGLSNFNARYRAANFSLEELPEVMRYLHGHNVRGYVTFNTLIFSDELPEAVRFVRAIAEAGADAVIVQDLGLAALIAQLCPGLHVHGSTQMTLTEPLGVGFVKGLGVRRVILARELSAADVRKIAAATDVPVEVFVHGALCVSYSGQCLTSEAIGGRSANRGQCAQACRLPYDLVVDGAIKDLGEKAYLLSPQDLAAYDLIDELADAGVCSFKIEGRLKSAHYVAATTQTYRAAIDASADRKPFQITAAQEADLAQSFSRGFTHGFFDGVNHQQLVHARFPKSRGVRMGIVVGTTRQGVLVELEPRKDERGSPNGFARGTEFRVGDGVVFDEGHPEQDEQGGRIASVVSRTPQNAPGRQAPVPLSPVRGGEGRGEGRNRDARHGRDDRNAFDRNTTRTGSAPHPSPLPRVQGRADQKQVVEITFERGGVNLSAVSVGSIVWKTDDPALRRRLETSFSRDTVARRVPLSAVVSAHVGELLTVVVRDDAGHDVTVSWDRILEVAQKFPLTAEVFREQFGRMGDSPFELASVQGLETPTGAMVPKSVLNDLRRQAVAKLAEIRDERERFGIADPLALDHAREEVAGRFGSSAVAAMETGKSHLHVLVRTMEQLQAVLDWSKGDPNAPTPHSPRSQRLSTVYCEFEDIRRYKEAVPLAKAAGVPIGLATVRIIKPGEEGLLRQIADSKPDCVLIRNLAGLAWFTANAPGLPLVGDYALNIANELTAGLLAGRGVERMVPSYDLNWTELSAMLARCPPGRFETVIHQHMPMFHMEHCVFCHTLSTGTSYKDCGRPCDDHRVDLRDRSGAANPLVADVGCRNTVYNAVAQSAAEFVPRMREVGIADFRVELLRESAADVPAMLDRYARVVSGEEDGRQAWRQMRQLRVLSQLGVTRGTLEG